VKGILLIFFSLLPTTIFSADYWDSHSAGWHWYEDPIILQSDNSKPAAKSPSDQQAEKELAQLQQTIKSARAKAVLYPTPENVYRYLQLQNYAFNKSTRFSQVWQQLTWQHPELTEKDSYPTNLVARQAYTESHNKREEKELQDAAKQYGLFFFFAGNCPYCHRFAPIFKEVADKYQFDVIPVTLDGKNLPEYPHPQINTGQAQNLHVMKWPAVYLVNAKKREVVPVSFGVISEAELKKRLVTLSVGLQAKEVADAKAN